MENDNGDDANKPANRNYLLRIFYAIQALLRTPMYGQPFRVGADIATHTLQHWILEAGKHLGLHPDAAYWLDLGLQATLTLALIGLMAKSAYDALTDLRDLWVKLRNRHKKPPQPQAASTKRRSRRLRGRRRRGKHGPKARRGFNKHGRRQRLPAKSKARGEKPGLPKPPV